VDAVTKTHTILKKLKIGGRKTKKTSSEKFDSPVLLKEVLRASVPLRNPFSAIDTTGGKKSEQIFARVTFVYNDDDTTTTTTTTTTRRHDDDDDDDYEDDDDDDDDDDDNDDDDDTTTTTTMTTTRRR